jgi:hypothetical protein
MREYVVDITQKHAGLGMLGDTILVERTNSTLYLSAFDEG